MAYLRCIVVTPEARVLDEEVREIVFPAQDGQWGVLPGHSPMLCILGEGLLRYRDKDNQPQVLFISGGFGHIRENEVTLLTQESLSGNVITESKAQRLLLEAQALPTHTTEEVEARTRALRRAKLLIALKEEERKTL
ncbi:MAG: ATP synthase F1 subunit epsilon [Sedimentisphaerales bacterium]|nr:ATP synthase F1 subunit epsilon [Sedimentisphaerales bacterium]